jgi:pilus assembly protein CpaB
MAIRRAQIIVLGITLAAGGGAFYMASRGPGEAPHQVQEAAPVLRTVDVLVAAVDVPTGRTLGAADLKWQPWPADAAPAGVIKKAETPNGVEDVAGSIVRYGFIGGEPIRKDKLIKADGSGFMAAILPAGMRAVAITIDTRGANSAGNFILPNDRVDVLRTFRDEEASRTQGIDVVVSETILNNIRVLAIGQNVQEKNGERVIIGETATLELDPRQAEVVTLAQKVGQLSLALRSIADASQSGEIVRTETGEAGITVVRYGIAKQIPKR